MLQAKYALIVPKSLEVGVQRRLFPLWASVVRYWRHRSSAVQFCNTTHYNIAMKQRRRFGSHNGMKILIEPKLGVLKLQAYLLGDNKVNLALG